MIPNLGLPVTPTIDTVGITIDSAGNFVVAAGSSGLFNGAPGYVTISPGSNVYAAHLSTPLVNTSLVPIPRGIAMAPAGGVLATVPSGNEVVSDAYQPVPLTGYKPGQIRHAYGVDQISFMGPGGATLQGDGTGQTIAILDLGTDPTILSDLEQFDRTFNLPDPQFQQINNEGAP